jgi:hypothetical protein
MSAPLPKRWVAKLCCRVCAVTFFGQPAAARADRTVCSTCGSSGRSGSRPGNSQRFWAPTILSDRGGRHLTLLTPSPLNSCRTAASFNPPSFQLKSFCSSTPGKSA